ncbi:MAG: hypothetical protein Q4D82_02520 [Neisseria sp.]|nr:hypothetical protein [Neisseria sp.]
MDKQPEMPSENGQNEQTVDLTAEQQAELAEKKRKSKAKIRTIRVWLWVIALLFAGFFFLSTCAMTKPQFKAEVVESCIRNVPMVQKWKDDMAARGLPADSGKLVADYCVCMWEEPIDKLTSQQIKAFGDADAATRLAMLSEAAGGEAGFEARDKQCVARLKVD